MNYFIVHATATMFVISTGAAPAYAASVIGAPNLSAVIVAILHCKVLSGDSLSQRPRYTIVTFRRFLILSSTFGVVGNMIHALAVNKTSVPLAVAGRFVFGFSSIEIVERELLRACHPYAIVSESARLIRYRIGGTIAGLLVGSLGESIPTLLEVIGARSFQATSWLMMALWFAQFVRLLVWFRAAKTAPDKSPKEIIDPGAAIDDIMPARSGSSDISSVESDVRNHSSVYYGSEREPDTDLSATYGSISSEQSRQNYATETSAMTSEKQPLVNSTRRVGFHQVKAFASRIRRLLRYHVAIPVSLFALFFTAYATETFLTGTPIIFRVYFDWNGVKACYFLET